MEKEVTTPDEATPDASDGFYNSLEIEFSEPSPNQLQFRNPKDSSILDPYDPANYDELAGNPAISRERILTLIEELKRKDAEERSGKDSSSSGQSIPTSSDENATKQPTSVDPASEIVRPGISSELIKSLGIRRVSREEAGLLLGLRCRGIYIPFPNTADKGDPYGRLRLDDDERRGDMKYFQRKHSSPHNYIQKDVSLHKNCLILVEGEFKSIALTEAGYPAIGMSGFYSWGEKLDPSISNSDHRLEPSLAATIERLRPAMLVLVGDSDTATNFQFSDAVTKLARTCRLPVLLPRIPYDAPHGKGVDDIRESLGQEKFKIWFDAAILDAEGRPVTHHTNRENLMFALLDKHETEFKKPTVDRDKVLERFYKMGIFLKVTHLDRLGEYVQRFSGTTPAKYKSQIASLRKVYRFKNGDDIDPELFETQLAKIISKDQIGPSSESTKGPAIEDNALNNFLIIGKEFYGYSYDPKTGTRSKSLSICDKSFVIRELRAAGYEASGFSNDETPVCGFIPHLSPLDAALVYLNRTRCKAMVKRLYRPYGPITEDDGSRVFNNSTVQVMTPVESKVELNDPRILFTRSWLTALLGEEQLDHFLSLLSYIYNNARKGTPRKTRAVFLVGKPSSGKTLLIDFFIPLLFGQNSAADAHRLFKGEMGASTVLETYVCKLSDADIGTSGSVRRIQMGILSLLADFTISGRLLYQNVMTEEVINLFMFSTNPDGSTVQLLKDMPESVAEKIAFYEASDGLLAVGERNEEDRFSPEMSYLLEYREKPTSALKEEAPYFCALLRDWQRTEVYENHSEPRFGVIPYFADSLKTVILPDAEESVIIELLENYSFEYKTATNIYEHLWGSSGESEELRSFEVKHSAVLRTVTAGRFREILITLSKTVPDLVQCHETKSGQRNSPKNRYFTISGRHIQPQNEVIESTIAGTPSVKEQ